MVQRAAVLGLALVVSVGSVGAEDAPRPLVQTRAGGHVDDGRIALVGAMYDIGSGRVTFLDR